MSLTEAERVAYHEAGHAVVLIELYPEQGIGFVTVDPQRAEAELCRYEPPAANSTVLGATKHNWMLPRSLRARLRRRSVLDAHEQPRKSVRREVLDEHGVYCCGGLAAEHLAARRRRPIVSSDLGSDGFSHDREAIGRYARVLEIEVPGVRRVVNYANHALEILRKRWPAVEALAQALLDGGTLQGQEVARIVAHASVGTENETQGDVT